MRKAEEQRKEQGKSRTPGVQKIEGAWCTSGEVEHDNIAPEGKTPPLGNLKAITLEAGNGGPVCQWIPKMRRWLTALTKSCRIVEKRPKGKHTLQEWVERMCESYELWCKETKQLELIILKITD